MQFSVALLAAAGVASAHWAPAHYNTTSAVEPTAYTTEVVTAYTTYCPSATEITHGGKTYTATEATTLTITNCPCTVTKPVTSTWAPSSSAVVVPYPSQNATSAQPTVYPTGSVGPTPSHTIAPVNGGNKAYAATGAGILAVFGLVAAL